MIRWPSPWVNRVWFVAYRKRHGWKVNYARYWTRKAAIRGIGRQRWRGNTVLFLINVTRRYDGAD